MKLILFLLLSMNALAEAPLNLKHQGDSSSRASSDAKLSSTQTDFLAGLFPNVGKPTMESRFSPALYKATQNLPPDDEILSVNLAALFNTVDDNYEITRIQTTVAESLNTAKSAEARNDRWIAVLERLKWAATRMLGTIVLDEELAKPFQEKFTTRLNEEMARSEEIKRRVAANDRKWLRDPNNIDPKALVSFVTHTKNKDFANSLATAMGWDNDLHLKLANGKSLLIDHGGKPAESLRAFNLDALEGASFSDKKIENPDLAWHWQDGALKPGFRPGRKLEQATTDPGAELFKAACLNCHGNVSTSKNDFKNPRDGRPLTRDQMISAVGGRMPPTNTKRPISSEERTALLNYLSKP